MPKLDSDITQFFQRFLTELRLILVLVLYFFSRRKKNAPERKVQKSFLIIPILSAVLIIYLHEAQIMRNSIDLIFSWIVTIIVIVINIITYILLCKSLLTSLYLNPTYTLPFPTPVLPPLPLLTPHLSDKTSDLSLQHLRENFLLP